MGVFHTSFVLETSEHHVLPWDLLLTESEVEWTSIQPSVTISRPGEQRPSRSETQTEEEVEMELALKHPDRRNPDIGRVVRVIKGPLKGFVGTLRNVMYHGDYEVELEAKLLTSRGILLF
ncbi:hypothetical protein SCP_1004840 [Sparassis crispa]|uniref:KOW domain-containing protein n=1 Tax=Sparassis crispa TaxID=139825 RepID=A0A401GYF1_9APHY|nr:hypothetical protein SCP_1004840 [Sparassis crispa]GBE87237.1 hypothetical protein SCP_1004840 [Sparassis crispa]